MREKGSLALYLLFFLPILIGIGAVAHDLSAVSSTQNALQSEIDRIALTAAHALPLKAAEDIARSSKITSDGYSIAAKISEDRSSIEVTALIKRPAGLFSIGQSLVQRRTNELSLEVKAAAQLKPVDALIILSDGVDMRPWINSDGTPEHSWGDTFPSEALTNCVLEPPNRYSNYQSPIRTLWSSYEGKRWLTQSCFNPVFSNIKVAAMSVADSIASIQSNRIGTVFTPGNSPSTNFQTIKALIDFDKERGFRRKDEAPKAEWLPYRDYDLELGDEACVFFSNEKIALNYALPFNGSEIGKSKGCSEPVLFPQCGMPFLIDAPHRFSFECLKHASLSEVIYWRSAKRPLESFTAEPDFFSALAEANRQFAEAEPTSLEILKRGNLALKPVKIIYLFATSLPALDPSNVPKVLQLIREAKITLVVTYLSKETLTMDHEKADNSQDWEHYLNSMDLRTGVADQLIRVNSLNDLLNKIPLTLIKLSRKVALKV